MRRTRKPVESSDREGAVSPVREHTRSHMEKLLRTATAVGAGVVLTCGRSDAQRPPQVCDPLPPPLGYCVDPDQFLNRGCVGQQNSWKKAAKQWHLELILILPPRHPSPDVLAFGSLTKQDITVKGAALREVKPDAARLTLVLAPAADAKEIELRLPVVVNQKPTPISVRVDVSKPPKEKGSVPVKILR